MNNLDRAVNNDFLVVTKSLLPYLNADRQKPVAIFIKAMELIYTINLFSNESSVRSMSRSQEAGWEKDFLNDVKSNLSSDKAYFIDAIMKLNEARNLLAKQEAATASASSEYHLYPADSGIPEDQPFPDAAATISSTKQQTSSSQKQPNPEQLIHTLSSMLDPNQAQLLKIISSLIMPQTQGGSNHET